MNGPKVMGECVYISEFISRPVSYSAEVRLFMYNELQNIMNVFCGNGDNTGFVWRVRLKQRALPAMVAGLKAKI
jgi:hypothetical protein